MKKEQKVLIVGQLIVILFLLCAVGFLWDKKIQMTRHNASEEPNAVSEGSFLAEKQQKTDTTDGNLFKEEGVTGNQSSGIAVLSTAEQAILQEDVVIDLKQDGVKPLSGKNIVVFGDSIWNTYRSPTGIAYQVAKETGATIYNCAINGTRASTDDETVDVMNNWHSKSLSTMIYIMMGIIDPVDQIKGEYAIRVVDKIDWDTVDYVLISYGIQDYLFNARLESEEGDYYGLNTYMGALRHAALRLHERYPNIKILFLAPTYCDIWVGPEDCTTHDEGHGTLLDYVEAMNIAAVQTDSSFLNMYEQMGISAVNAMDYMEDSIFLNEKAREKYAEIVTESLIKMK
ncbi:MAG: GDSL-type esterase/lipase family protein [Lachnospiraceae bacterium]|nr:GDSL-type esterase/lipase family protein [Lachnospiraceae bacterium]